jgi:flagella basal body P-ring formation protein FlgA
MDGQMKFISLAGNAVQISAPFAAVCLVGIMAVSGNPAMANQTLSGAMIKAEIESRLALRGFAADPELDDERQFLPCAAALEIEPMFGSFKTVRVSCDDPDGFSIAVRTQIQNLKPRPTARKLDQDNVDLTPAELKAPADYKEADYNKIVRLSRSLGRGEVIMADDLVLVSSPHNRIKGYFEDPTHVIGRKTNRALSVNQVLQSRHLEMDWLIQKDQTVTIETQIGAVTVAGIGVALDNGQMGDLLKVLNQSSNVVIEGRVVSEKKIKIITK